MDKPEHEEFFPNMTPDIPQDVATIDETVFNTMHDVLGDENFAELISTYEESMTSILDQMPKALEANSDGELERLAHSAKSANANIGAMRLSDLARHTEEQAHDGKLSSASKNISAMQEEFARVQEFLNTAYRKNKQP